MEVQNFAVGFLPNAGRFIFIDLFDSFESPMLPEPRLSSSSKRDMGTSSPLAWTAAEAIYAPVGSNVEEVVWS